MSSILSGLEGVTNNFLLGYAIGRAAGPALEPFVQDLANEAWSLHPDRPPDPYTLADGVAQGQVDPDQAAAWAKESGLSGDVFAALVDIANVGPALGSAYEAWRRGALGVDDFNTALKRTGLEERWYAAMRVLKDRLLDPGAIATAVHRGIMEGSGLLVTPVPGGQGAVPRIPVSSIDPVTEAEGLGYTQERLRVLIANTGLPLALGQMLHLLNMGVVTETDVQVAVAESNIRNEYMDVALALRRRLLTPHEYEEAALRGLISNAAADAGAALSGMEPQDAQLLFQIMGRPLVVHQITTGLARGATLGGTYNDVPEPYRDAIRRSNIRPEYARLAYANRYSYSVPLWWRALLQSGALTPEDARQLLLNLGNPPDLAQKITDHFAAPSGAKADPWVAKADTQLWTATHKGYVGGAVDPAGATAAFDLIGIDPDAQTAVLARWDAEKAL